MHKQLILVLAVVVLTCCGGQPVPQPPANDESKDSPRAEVRVGGGENERHHLPFKITAVHEKRKPTTTAPFHAGGGEWTYFDCQPNSDPNVAFTVGVLSKSGDGNAPVAWGKAVLIVKDREAGARFVELFSKAFSTKLPSPPKQAHTPAPFSIGTAILGENVTRTEQGGFFGRGGGWTATKWFPEEDGRSAEVYFNYNAAKREGEFSEKDDNYGDDLVAIFAAALRDGPRPERTPETDPNLTRVGPAIGQPRKLLSERTAHESFSPKSRFVVYQDNTTIFALPLDQPDAKPFEVVRFDHSPRELRVLDEDLNLLVQEGIPEKPGVQSSDDPMRIWWVDGKTKQKKLLRGPEKNLDLADELASPDQRYVALSQWQGEPGKGEERIKVLHILDRNTGKTVTCRSKAKDLSVIGWTNTSAGMRLVAVTNRWQITKEPSELYHADPATGNLERQETFDVRLDIDNPLSPDGKHRVRVGKNDLTVFAVPNGGQRRFVFHEEDRRFVDSECVEWVSPVI
jgi:hypothetical protein